MFSPCTLFSQLSIKPHPDGQDNFIYSKGNLLFVSGAVNLNKNFTGSPTKASIYLREEVQLIQGSKSTSQNA